MEGLAARRQVVHVSPSRGEKKLLQTDREELPVCRQTCRHSHATGLAWTINIVSYGLAKTECHSNDVFLLNKPRPP